MKATLLLLFLSTLTCGFNIADYDSSIQLDSNYNLHWKIRNQDIYLAMEVSTLGWVGFGVAEPTSGSMPGADVVIGYVENGVARIEDRHTLAKETPIMDSCQNWILVGGEEGNGKTIIEVRRPLDTGDSQDRSFHEGIMKVIYAFGTSDTLSYHLNNRRATGIKFYGPQEPNLLNATDVFTHEFRNNYFVVPNVTTHYQDQEFSIPFLGDEDIHLIGFEAIFDPASQHLVHHFILGSCVDENTCTMFWAWAPGIAPLVLPAVAGFRVSNSTNGYKILTLETHYDNPTHQNNIMDNGGVRVYYTRNLRQYDAGVMELGDPTVSQPRIIGANEVATFEYGCPSQCTSQWHPITVFGDLLHMHQIGAQMWSTHWRNNQKIGFFNRVEFYDFNFQQVTPMNNVVIQPGDRIQTHCIFKGRNIPTTFSLGSSDEMCIEYLFYYPALSSLFCAFYHDDTRNFTLCNNEFLTINSSQLYHPVDVDPPGGEVKLFGAVNVNYTCPAVTSTPTSSSTTPQEDSSGMLHSFAFFVMFFLVLFAM